MSHFLKFYTKSLAWVRQTFVPLLLILLCPPTVFLFWYTNVALGGSFTKLGELFAQEGIWTTIQTAWAPYFFGSAPAWTILSIFAGLELLLMRFLPEKNLKDLSHQQEIFQYIKLMAY